MKRVSRGIDRIEVVFDDPSLVASAGLLVPATLMARLGLEALVNEWVRLVGRVGGASPGRKVLTLVATILAGGSHIDHANVLRAGATQAVLGFRVMAPSTLGTFLRAFTFGHVRQLDRVIAEAIRRAWALGAGPGGGPLVIDVDSTICEVHGHKKQGAAYGYTRKLGYHPLLATRADTGEVLHARLRKGSSQRGHKRFVEELAARVRRAGATGAVCVRADGGFWSHELIDTLDRLGVGYSITVRINKTIRAAIAAIAEDTWTPIVYPDSGQAAVAETTYVTGRGRKRRSYRLVVRRSRLTDPAQQALWPDWRYHAFVTSSTTDTVTADRFHRDHAVVELAIGDLKDGAGMEHCPSGRFFANAAWLACAVLAHNLFRWCATLGGIRHLDELTVARTLRTRLIAMPARLVNHAGTPRWRGPLNWPWAHPFTHALTNLRALRPVPT
ncbi:MAG TPA: IS1380 family transposase [Acidimicrobiales bacterium]|nr:IS1380 family transposase [Acidimicrobiales bacterium]